MNSDSALEICVDSIWESGLANETQSDKLDVYESGGLELSILSACDFNC